VKYAAEYLGHFLAEHRKQKDLSRRIFGKILDKEGKYIYIFCYKIFDFDFMCNADFDSCGNSA